jgi:flagellar biosynthetic protein FliR
MPTTLIDYMSLTPAFALVLARLAGLTIAAPIFSSTALPRVVKVYLVLAMAAAIFPMAAPYVGRDLTLAGALAGMLGEFALGAVLGLSVNLMLLATQLTGAIIEQQSGLAISQMIDPMTGGHASVLGEMYFIIAGLIFLAIGGERELVRTLLESFSRVPVMSFRPDASTCGVLIDTLAASFVLGVQLAAPPIIALLLTSVAIGFLARTVPQLNVMSIGFSIKVFVALAVLAGTLPLASSVLEDGFAVVFESMHRLLSPAGG